MLKISDFVFALDLILSVIVLDEIFSFVRTTNLYALIKIGKLN